MVVPVEVVVDVVVVDVVEVVVVVVVVVVVPAAYADAAPSAAANTPRTRSQTPRRIAPVCRSARLFADLLQRRGILRPGYTIGTCGSRLDSIRSRISVRLEPVAVIPWLRRPTTACAGSGAAATSAATLSASSEVPQG